MVLHSRVFKDGKRCEVLTVLVSFEFSAFLSVIR